MKINIYYGGRGLLDDPTLYVISRIENVLKELRVKVERYNIYEHKNEIATLPQTFKDVDGIILATTVEWLGIGGYMQQFLDACWLYGDKEKISNTYMQPIVMSTTYGEREAETTLCNAWEILGGLPCSGLCGYVEDITTFQLNKEYNLIIEKLAEYRQHLESGPLRDMRMYQKLPAFLDNPRMFSGYPELAVGVARDLFTIDGSAPELMRKKILRHGKKVGFINLIKDGMKGVTVL
mgnify:CR=1 FL=1